MKMAQLLLASGYNRDLNPGCLWGMVLCGMFLMLSGASRFSWGVWSFWEPSYGFPMVGLVTLAYFASAVASSRLKLLPRAEGLGVIAAAVTLSFVAVIAVLAFGRVYYSRSFILVSCLFSLVWLPLSYFLGSRIQSLKLAVVPGGMSDELVELPGVDWRVLQLPEIAGHCSGVAVDLHQKLSSSWVRFLSDCSLKRIPVYHSAVVYEALTGRVSLSHLSEGILDDFKVTPLYSSLKRAADLLIVFMAAPFIIPLGFVVAFAIRMDSAGPALFAQERMGLKGEGFRMYKFRSMRVELDTSKESFTTPRDRRITRVGRIIRRFRLDEIPQFWNILKGEMSLIGPRPEQISFAGEFEKLIPYYNYRHLVRPGISGWAQVNQGYVDGSGKTKDKLEFDLYYIKHISPLLDVLICLKTLRTVLTGFGSR